MSNSIVIQTNSTVIEDMKQQYKHSLSPKLRKADLHGKGTILHDYSV